MPNGNLIALSAEGLHEIDPRTGEASDWAPHSPDYSGDILPLPGGAMYALTDGGEVQRIDGFPDDPAAPFPFTSIEALPAGNLWDAASPGDLCTDLAAHVAADRAGGAELGVGEEITYTVRFTNTEGTANAPVDHVVDLTGLVDDAELITGPRAGGGLSAGPAATAGGRTTFPVTGEVPTGG